MNRFLRVFLTALLLLNMTAPFAQAAEDKTPLNGSELIDGLDQPYAAPDFQGIEEWINSDPLTLQKLKGKVVLVDFWTFSCINCLRTLPYLTKWYDTYKDDGFVIVGVHAPEFGFEKKRENLEKSLDKNGITYPIAQDNNFATWKAYKNKYWPAHYLIDKNGKVVYAHFGEGKYDITENNIRYLLDLKGDVQQPENATPYSSNQTPETYLGTKRAAREVQTGENIPLNHWFLKGDWERKPEYIESKNENGTYSIKIHFSAKKVFLVMESADGKPKIVTIREKDKKSMIEVDASRLYTVFEADKMTDGEIAIAPHEKGVRLYAFTFES
ncbi:MAG: thioredoxin family protein [Pseudobdellovibrionaceae bacterium]